MIPSFKKARQGQNQNLPFFISISVILVFISTFGAQWLHSKSKVINGAGATFPYPIYSKWFYEYEKVNSNTLFNYQSIGSGGGIRQLIDQTIDFGASDAPMNSQQLSKTPKAVLHIPTVLGAVALIYHIPNLDQKGRLQLSADVIGDIFLGKISKWNDSRIQALNPTLKLPAIDLVLIHRSDGSGTTQILSDYLSKISSAWKERVGVGPALRWPVGIGGKGNEGITGLVKQMPGAIGYVELVFAHTTQLPVVFVQNQEGQFVEPSPQSVSIAAENSLKFIPSDFRTSITNAPGKGSYPLSAFTYFLIYQEMNINKGKCLQEFLMWAITFGQSMAEPMAYAPLPKSLIPRIQNKINQMRFNNSQ